MTFKQSCIYRTAKKMPPLYHKLPGQEYDDQKSRVFWWLTKQPEVLNYVWNKLVQSGAVKYDANTGKWQGVDFCAEDD